MNLSRLERRLGTVAVALSTAVVLVALAIVPFLTPPWVAFEQGRTGAAELTGFTPSELRTATDAILGDLVLGPPDFDVRGARSGQPILTAAERAHMRDVRAVFGSFYLVAALAVLILGITALMSRKPTPTWSRRDTWRAVRLGALGLGATIAVAGVIALIAFDAAFAVFHQLFFSGGNYLFDPRTSKLVQLFPDAFWFETSVVVGAVIFLLALATASFAGRRLRTSTASSLHPASRDMNATLTAADPEGVR